MNLLYPKFPVRQLSTMLRITALGALIAGLYGALHDQISYAISPEYFTKMKFEQFSYADFGWTNRIFVAEVGFLATWWVGLIAGWILARSGLAAISAARRRRATMKAFAIMTLATATIGFVGAMLGVWKSSGDLGDWNRLRNALQIDDLRSFVVVAYLHAAGYLGAIVGVIIATVYVRKIASP